MHNWHNILFKFGLFEKITLYQQLLSKLASKIDTGKEDLSPPILSHSLSRSH